MTVVSIVIRKFGIAENVPKYFQTWIYCLPYQMIICKTSTEKIFLARTKELGITENITQVRHKIWISFNHTYCLSDQTELEAETLTGLFQQDLITSEHTLLVV